MKNRTSPPSSSWGTLVPALRELGVRRVAALAAYRLGLRSGRYRRALNARLAQRLADGVALPAFRPIWSLPSAADLRAILTAGQEQQLIAAADEILTGRVRLFGAVPSELRLSCPEPLQYWTTYESGTLPDSALPGGALPGSAPQDIKWIWEPARFGWAFALGRAYRLSGDERLPQAFWQQAETFLHANPAYLGPHWASAQEAALRLMAFSFALHVFQDSPHTTPERVLVLLRSIAVHAGRIPPTLAYARAQDNNHLLSEAAGLVTAAALLPAHPQAAAWQRLGWREFRRGLASQIAPDGAYSQHSSNYHRLMLQLGVWMACLAGPEGSELDDATLDRLEAATRWLLALVDPAGGRVPNLGPNDGAYIFPFSVLPFEDYRPALQAAGLAFLGEAPFPSGAWDEMSAWFPQAQGRAVRFTPPPPPAPYVLRAPDGRSWAYLRAARFTGRPGHADQLHLDLWRDGLNLAQDAGTFAYTAAPPWDNALAASRVHNTVTVDGLDQMRRAGRFLYLDWAQAELLAGSLLPASAAVYLEGTAGEAGGPYLVARHDGYRRLGLTHTRRVAAGPGGDWVIEDSITGPGWGAAHTLALHWLLPDWPWHAAETSGGRAARVILDGPRGRVTLSLRAVTASGGDGDHRSPGGLQIVRAGEVVHGAGPAAPILGWVSPTYGVKLPALSVSFLIAARAETRFVSRFIFD